MFQDGLIRRENLQIRPVGINEVNPVAALLKFHLQRVHRDFVRNRLGPKLKFPSIKENPAINHLIAEIRVEQAGLKALVDSAQDAAILSADQPNYHPKLSAARNLAGTARL